MTHRYIQVPDLWLRRPIRPCTLRQLIIRKVLNKETLANHSFLFFNFNPWMLLKYYRCSLQRSRVYVGSSVADSGGFTNGMVYGSHWNRKGSQCVAGELVGDSSSSGWHDNKQTLTPPHTSFPTCTRALGRRVCLVRSSSRVCVCVQTFSGKQRTETMADYESGNNRTSQNYSFSTC